ncbi:hypothetical protein WK28_04520 [Burkholderia vietnamiensis]|nr:hypothetical protein WK28_04520 [Burkholderia vietnamiensis]
MRHESIAGETLAVCGRDQYSVSRLCRVPAVSRRGYCQWRARPPSAKALANEALDVEVAAIYRASRGS